MYTIAIDGPAGAGKSTVAKLLAKKLNIKYINTGAMYRAITLLCLKKNIDINNKKRIIELVHNSKIIVDDDKIILNNKDLSEEIRSSKVDALVSKVASIKEVRYELVNKQKKMAQNTSVVMEGRDIATKVLPDADFKFFITASKNARAERRYKDLKKNGEKISFNKVLNQIKKRDEFDKTRKYSPLIQAKEAIEINTTSLNVDEVMNIIINKIQGDNTYG